MNAERLNSIVTALLESEKTNGIQKALENLNNNLANLVGQPQHGDIQKSSANALNQLEIQLDKFFDSLEPADKELLREIDGWDFFAPDTAKVFREKFERAGPTPAVLHQDVQAFQNRRNEYLNSLKAIRDNFKKLNIGSEQLKAGEAELSVLIPRDIFKNELVGLKKEIGTLIFVIRAFSQIAHSAPPSIQVNQISTSNPNFWLGLDPETVKNIGSTITWLLGTIKSLGDIRKLIRELTAKGADEEDVKAFEAKEEARIEKLIDARVAEMMKEYKGPPTQQHQVAGELKLSINILQERIENGVLIYVRALPPPKAADAPINADGSPTTPQEAQIAEIEAIAKQLVYPELIAPSTLRLTHAEAEQKTQTVMPPKKPK